MKHPPFYVRLSGFGLYGLLTGMVTGAIAWSLGTKAFAGMERNDSPGNLIGGGLVSLVLYFGWVGATLTAAFVGAWATGSNWRRTGRAPSAAFGFLTSFLLVAALLAPAVLFFRGL